MARQEDVDTAIWDDIDFLALSPIARAVYLWSFTNQRCGMAGIYKVGWASMQMETGWKCDELQAAISELQAQRFLSFDGRVLFVRTRVKRLRTKVSSIAKNIARDLERFGTHEYVTQFWDQNVHECWLFDNVEQPTRGGTQGVPTPSVVPTDTLTTPGVQPQGGLQGMGMVKEVEGGVGETRRKPSPPDPDAYPAELPQELRPAADQIVVVLQRVADAMAAKVVTRAAVGRAIVAYPGRDHLAVANDVEHYWVFGPGAGKKRSDIVLTWRNRLDGAPVISRPSTPTGAVTGDDWIERLEAAKANLKNTIPPKENVA